LAPRVVIARPDVTGTAEGAALLAIGPDAEPQERADPPPVPPCDIDLSAYAEDWRRLAAMHWRE